ncbi:hypothetical protein D3C81_1894150 [compost metagenome]
MSKATSVGVRLVGSKKWLESPHTYSAISDASSSLHQASATGGVRCIRSDMLADTLVPKLHMYSSATPMRLSLLSAGANTAERPEETNEPWMYRHPHVR